MMNDVHDDDVIVRTGGGPSSPSSSSFPRPPQSSRNNNNSTPPGSRGRRAPNVSSPEEEEVVVDDGEEEDPMERRRDYDDIDEEHDDDPNEVAAAAAEVAAMEHGTVGTGRGNNNNSTRIGDEAVMGAVGMEDGIANFEPVDESGELVRQAFLQFLSEYRQEVQTEEDDHDDHDGNNDDENQNRPVTFIYPYLEQAKELANNQLRRRSSGNSEEEDDDVDNNQEGRTNTLMSGGSGMFATTLFLNFQHVLKYDPELADAIQGQFCRFESYLRKAIQSFVIDLHPELEDPATTLTSSTTRDPSTASSSTYFISVYNMPSTQSIRRLRTDLIGSLASVTGTVTRTSDVRPELLIATFTCKECGLPAGNIVQQYHYTRPTICRNPRCKTTSPKQFKLDVTKSQFVDWQKLRVQENSNQIPPGSMPRSMDVILRNEMVERAKAGDKCVFTGSLVVIPDGSALARAGEAAQASKSNRPSDAATGGGGGIRGLAALGVRELTYRTCFVATSVLPSDAIHQANQNEQIVASLLFGKFNNNNNNKVSSTNPTTGGSSSTSDHHEETADEVAMEYTRAQREELLAMKSSPRLYEQMVESIAPTTFGHKEVKKGILLMLLGGVHKTTVDGIKLRGDINVCVVGDPSTAKSQFLKYVHSFLPSRAVYTSGKASSAAGLTASVQRDQDTGEYCLEAGALMLADNGICCIDEFDKMDPTDQVAIHEAMEQQTISITKAGIQATLNARASILAAANPIYGRYDRSKTLKSNVALSAPILSRFDLFFVVLDDCNPAADKQVARHILNVHRCEEKAVNPPFTKDQMRRYIRFARTLHPKLTKESQAVMVDCYRKLRQSDTLGRSRSAYRITVRQLESMVRLSEALARLHCADEIQPSYVREAFRLLKTSIIQVESSDVEVDDDDDDDDGPPDDQGNFSGEQAVNNDDDSDMEKQQEENETEESERMETQGFQQYHPGEYNGNEEELPLPQTTSTDTAATTTTTTEDINDSSSSSGQKRKHSQSETDDHQNPVSSTSSNNKGTKKKKKKLKISFAEYEAIANAVAGHLRALESTTTKMVDDTDNNDDNNNNNNNKNDNNNDVKYLTWGNILEWYLEQSEDEIGDSLERLDEMRKKVNLVIRRLINVDRILVTIGDAPKNKKEELNTLLGVHPNHDVSQM